MKQGVRWEKTEMELADERRRDEEGGKESVAGAKHNQAIGFFFFLLCG